jgi:hypothetical protein
MIGDNRENNWKCRMSPFLPQARRERSDQDYINFMRAQFAQ